MIRLCQCLTTFFIVKKFFLMCSLNLSAALCCSCMSFSAYFFLSSSNAAWCILSHLLHAYWVDVKQLKYLLLSQWHLVPDVKSSVLSRFPVLVLTGTEPVKVVFYSDHFKYKLNRTILIAGLFQF